MDKRYRLVVFDWEGTLSDTLGQVLNCVALEARRLDRELCLLTTISVNMS